MIELKKEFKKKGVQYTQLWKDDKVIVYLCTRTDEADTYFEVFKPKTQKPDKFHDDEYEVYPCDESFGSWAWCCSNVKSVEKMLNKHFTIEYADNILQEIAKFKEM